MEKEEFSLDQAKTVVLLTAALVMTATWAVGAAGWTKGLNVVTFIGLGVILIGLMLARSILPGVVAHVFSLIIGVAWSFWVTSRLLPTDYTWLERWQNLVLRLNYWYSQALQGGTSYDNLMFVLQMNVILWGMGYLTVWFVFRSHKVWQAIVPGGLVLLINLYYAPKDITTWFLVYLLLSLLLVVRFNLLNQESKWRAEGVFFRPDIGFDFLRDGFIFSLLVIALAWMAPPVVDAKSLEFFDEFQGSWRDFQSEWNRLYADLNYRNSQSAGTFGQALRLGGPRRLTDEPVMDVKVEGGPGRYWRAVTYDEYTGTGWRSTDGDTGSFGPDADLALPIFEARQPVTQTYTFYRDGRVILYAMANPIFLDRSAKVHYNALSDEQALQTNPADWTGEQPWAEEVTYIRSNATVDSNESYQVVSLTSQATVNQLRTAGTDYPAWVTERYLQLPKSPTERTLRLARELAEPYDNPYDQAHAIEQYLRKELAYNERMAAPPPEVDKVDYILFEAKEAYCDYYASSMIVMLRSLDIPARLAAGFARGTYNSELDLFHVVNADAHSWVEVYFPQYGWLEFEPTAAQPTVIRPIEPAEDSQNPLEEALNDGLDRDELPQRPENIPIDDEAFGGGAAPLTIGLPWLGTQISVPWSTINTGATIVGLLLLAGMVGLAWWGRKQLNKPTENVAALYQQMVRLAGWMGIVRRPWQTPYEHATVLEHVLPRHRGDIHIITDEYVRHTFSPPGAVQGGFGRNAAHFSAVMETNFAWQRLRTDMLKSAFKRRLPRWLKRS